MRIAWLRVECVGLLILLGSYAFFWHSRDWNTASRLILTYAMVDRGTVCLDGLDRQTGDIASFQGHYYCDKLPGFSLLAATVPYASGPAGPGLPPHPLERAGHGLLAGRLLGHAGHLRAVHGLHGGAPGAAGARPGLLAAGRGARGTGLRPGHAGLRLRDARLRPSALGVRPPRGVLPALEPGDRHAKPARLVTAGFLASYAAVIELQVGPVSAILGIYLAGSVPERPPRPDALAYFALGAAMPSPALAGLQPAGVRLALGHGLLSPRHGPVRPGPQPPEPAGPAASRTST